MEDKILNIRSEEGIGFVVVLFVLILLTALGITLLFSVETERAISRNYSYSIQAEFSAEAGIQAAVEALRYDLAHDVNGWKNQYLAIPTPSNPSSPPAGAYQDTTGSITGTRLQWYVDLTYTGGTAKSFPFTTATLLHTALKPALPWAFESFADGNPVEYRLAFRNASDDVIPFTPKKAHIYVTGVGSSKMKVRTAISRVPATVSQRAIEMKIYGNTINIWKNALVGGNPGSGSVVTGDYKIHGSVLQFNSTPGQTVMDFASDYTGVFNNYEGWNALSKVDYFWLGYTEANATPPPATYPLVRGSQASPSTCTSANYPGPFAWCRYSTPKVPALPLNNGEQTLRAEVRVKAGLVYLRQALSYLGRPEVAANGYADALDGIYGPGPPTDTAPSPLENVILAQSPATASNNVNTYTGGFDFSGVTDFVFPNLNGNMRDDETGLVYSSYRQYIHNDDSATQDTRPGIWALDLTGIGGTADISAAANTTLVTDGTANSVPCGTDPTSQYLFRIPIRYPAGRWYWKKKQTTSVYNGEGILVQQTGTCGTDSPGEGMYHTGGVPNNFVDKLWLSNKYWRCPVGVTCLGSASPFVPVGYRALSEWGDCIRNKISNMLYNPGTGTGVFADEINTLLAGAVTRADFYGMHFDALSSRRDNSGYLGTLSATTIDAHNANQKDAGFQTMAWAILADLAKKQAGGTSQLFQHNILDAPAVYKDNGLKMYVLVSLPYWERLYREDWNSTGAYANLDVRTYQYDPIPMHFYYCDNCSTGPYHPLKTSDDESVRFGGTSLNVTKRRDRWVGAVIDKNWDGVFRAVRGTGADPDITTGNKSSPPCVFNATGLTCDDDYMNDLIGYKYYPGWDFHVEIAKDIFLPRNILDTTVDFVAPYGDNNPAGTDCLQPISNCCTNPAAAEDLLCSTVNGGALLSPTCPDHTDGLRLRVVLRTKANLGVAMDFWKKYAANSPTGMFAISLDVPGQEKTGDTTHVPFKKPAWWDTYAQSTGKDYYFRHTLAYSPPDVQFKRCVYFAGSTCAPANPTTLDPPTFPWLRENQTANPDDDDMLTCELLPFCYHFNHMVFYSLTWPAAWVTGGDPYLKPESFWVFSGRDQRWGGSLQTGWWDDPCSADSQHDCNMVGGNVCNWLGERFVTGDVSSDNEREDGFLELLGATPPSGQGTQRNNPARNTACGGYSSLKGAGVTMTEKGGVTFGAPQTSAGYLVYPGTAPSMATPDTAQTAPVVIDGRILLVSYNDSSDSFDDATAESDYNGALDAGFRFGKNPYRTTSGNVVFYDHVISTQEFGCSDFVGEVAYKGSGANFGGETHVRSSIPSATTPSLLPVIPLISSYSVSTDLLKVDVRNGSTTKGASLTGSWIANSAQFGTVSSGQKPTELIGVPSVSQEPACNHPYLPARKNYSVTRKLSFSEVDVIPSN